MGFSSLNRTIDYAYPNTRVSAWKSFMLKDEDIRGLSSAKNLEEYVGLLEHTAYKTEISKITRMDVNSIEDLLSSNYIRMGELARRIAPKKTKTFFDALQLSQEILLIKRIMNLLDAGLEGKNLGIDYSKYEGVISSDIKKLTRGLGEVKNNGDVIELLKHTRYDFIQKASAEEMRIPGYVSTMLDKYYLTNLWESLDTISSKDAKITRKLIGMEIDAANIMVLLKAKQGKYKGDRFMIPATYKLGGKLRELSGKEVSEIVSALSGTPYAAILSEGLKAYEKDGSLITFENLFKKYIIKEYKSAFKSSLFTIGVLLGFLKIKEYELRNLQTIAVSLDNGLDSKDIMELVIE
jgi:V/A-type H+/Na+-transporting ATPase subunit C